jgi:hypothetical protein
MCSGRTPLSSVRKSVTGSGGFTKAEYTIRSSKLTTMTWASALRLPPWPTPTISQSSATRVEAALLDAIGSAGIEGAATRIDAGAVEAEAAAAAAAPGAFDDVAAAAAAVPVAALCSRLSFFSGCSDGFSFFCSLSQFELMLPGAFFVLAGGQVL